MSRSANREYSSTDISSLSRYTTIRTACASNTTGTQRHPTPISPNHNPSRKYKSQKDSISDVTVNNTIYSGETTPKRRVIKCKDANEEEIITYHLKLKPESLQYTFSTTEPKKTSFYSEKHLDQQGTARLACHSKLKDLSSAKNSASQNSDYLNCRAKCNDEKTTYCRPIVNLHTGEFVQRTIDKNNKLKRLVRDIVEAREKEKKQEAWNNYINELKSKHGYNYYPYGPIYLHEQSQLERENIINCYNLPCKCVPWPNINDDSYKVSNTSDYIMNSYPNEILCYPISSAARLATLKHKNETPRHHGKTEYVIHAEEGKPRKRKRRQLSDNQIRNISAQTSGDASGISSKDTDEGRYKTKKGGKDANEGYEPCVCAADNVRDGHTNTDREKVEQETVTDIEKNNTSSHACFCKNDDGMTVVKYQIPALETKNNIESIDVDIFLRDFMKKDEERDISDFKTKKQDSEKDLLSKQKDNQNVGDSKKYKNLSLTAKNNEERIRELIDDSIERKKYELGNKATYKSVQENMTKLKEELGQSKTYDNSLGIIEDKLDNIISTMNDLLSEVKLRMLDMNIEKFDTATSTMLSDINEEHGTCIAYKLLEKEFEIPERSKKCFYNAKLNKVYNKDIFERDRKVDNKDDKTETMTPLNYIPTPINKIDTALSSHGDPAALRLTHAESFTEMKNAHEIKNESLEHLVAEIKISLLQTPSEHPNNVVDLQFGTTPQPGVERLSATDLNSAEVPHSVETPQPVSDHLSVKDLNSVVDPQSVAKPQTVNDLSPTANRSIIELKKPSKSFMDNLLRSGPNLSDENPDILATSKASIKRKSWLPMLQKKEEDRNATAIPEENVDAPETAKKSETKEQSKEEDEQITSIPEENKWTEENSDPNQPDNKKSTSSKTKRQEFCCVLTNIRNIPRPRHRHASVTASLHREISNTAEIMLEENVYFSNDLSMNKKGYVPVDRAVSKIDAKNLNTGDKCKSTKLCIVVDRAVSKIEENLFSKNHSQNCILVDRAVSQIDDIMIEEINKSNQAKKDINELLNREIAKNYGVQIKFEIPTKERATEVTDSLSKTRASNTSSSQGKKYYSSPSRQTPLTISAVNTDPMSLLGLFQMSTDTVRQLLTYMNFDYSSYLPSVSRTLPMVTSAMQYLCHICGAAFVKPSELSYHMKGHHLDSGKDCCVCRHLLQLRQQSPGIYECGFCGRCFTRAYCCDLHERTCARRRGRTLDVSESRAILK